MLIFAAQADLDFLAQCSHWFADGTFRVTPQGFDQLYTLHGFSRGAVYPCVYALLPGRSEEVYRGFLDRVVQLSNGLNPVSIMTDFEMAAIRAMQRQFPTVEVTGCMFHFGQCVWRKLQSEGMAARYNAEPDFAGMVKQMLALAFVPVTDVVQTYETLTEPDEFRVLDPVIDYFEDNFVGRLRRGRRGLPRFPIELWNQYDRVITRLPRSNNAVEGWHNAFNNVVYMAHPTPIKLAQKLQVSVLTFTSILLPFY